MRPIQLEELKKIELRILKEIHKICIDNGFRYSLCGGTLLGAVRHGGFIPWDDDIDIFMPRPDYNRFISYCKDHETPFRLIANEIDVNYSYLFAKAIDPNTCINELNGNRTQVDLGVYVDIFPIDGLAENYEQAKRVFKKSHFERELLVSYNWKKFFRSKTHSMIYEPIRFVFYLMSRCVNPKKIIARIQAKYPSNAFDETQYAGVICGGYRLKEILPTKVFLDFDKIIFEGYEFMAIKDWRTYLSSIYGDFMQLPPEEKRVAHHTFEAYYK